MVVSKPAAGTNIFLIKLAECGLQFAGKVSLNDLPDLVST